MHHVRVFDFENCGLRGWLELHKKNLINKFWLESRKRISNILWNITKCTSGVLYYAFMWNRFLSTDYHEVEAVISYEKQWRCRTSCSIAHSDRMHILQHQAFGHYVLCILFVQWWEAGMSMFVFWVFCGFPRFAQTCWIHWFPSWPVSFHTWLGFLIVWYSSS